MKNCFILVAHYNYHEFSETQTKIYTHGYATREQANQHINEFVTKIEKLKSIGTLDQDTLEVDAMEIELE